MRKIKILIWLTAILSFGCQEKPTSTVERMICDMNDQEIKTYFSLSQEEQLAKFGHCDLSSFGKTNPALTPERVELINKQVAFELGLLGYNKRLLEEPVLTESIKGFQRSLGEPESGRLTHKQLLKANEIASKKTYFEVRLPLNGNGFKPNINNMGDKLEFQGTWEVEGESLEGPYKFSDSKFNFWDYECDREAKKCKSIHVDFGVTDEVVGIGRFEKGSYNVLSWSTDKVVIRDDTYNGESCRKSIITIDLKDGDVEQKVNQQNKCRGYSDLIVPKVLSLVSSWEQAKKLNSYRLEQTLSAYTEDYMKLKSAR